MRINNKGFAISSMLYSILLLFLMLLLGVFAILGSRKVILDKIKSEIVTDLTQNRSYNFLFEHQNIALSNTSKVSNYTFDLLDGVVIVDQNGNMVEATITTTSSPTFNSAVNGTYTVNYSATYEGKNIEAQRVIEVVDPIILEYAYTGDVQELNIANKGVYRAELWGASGGDFSPYTGGKGAYTSGNIDLTAGTNLYIYIGGKGVDKGATGGYNGGGTLAAGQEAYGSSGGGATDIRLNNAGVSQFESLKSRIMVAAGGGGANLRSGDYGEGNGGAGGTLTGLNGISTNNTNGYGYGIGTGGTQTAGGVVNWTPGTQTSISIAAGAFGQGGGIQINNISAQSGGGSGYYGGSASAHGGAGGGSSYISGYPGVNSIAQMSTATNIIHSGLERHYSNRIFYNGIMKSGEEVMPTFDGTSTMTGNTGNGYAKITSLLLDK